MRTLLEIILLVFSILINLFVSFTQLTFAVLCSAPVCERSLMKILLPLILSLVLTIVFIFTRARSKKMYFYIALTLNIFAQLFLYFI